MSVTAADLHSPHYRAHPEQYWRQLQDEHPVFHDTVADLWWLTRYHDVQAVFRDHETYSAATYEQSTGAVIGPTLISRDDRGHVVRRSIVAPDFVGRRLEGWHALIDRCVDALIDDFEHDRTIDFIAQFSARLPVDVIAGMLGMAGDGRRFRDWVTDMIRGLASDPELRSRGVAAREEFCAHIAPALDGVDDPERSDHIAKIARAEVDGERLSHEEITAFCGLLFIAGGETTDKAMANMWWNLLRDPDRFEQVLAAPELWDAAFSETMRRTPPVTSEDRFTTRDVEWYGQTIPAGARVRVSMGAAHLDPTVFDDPLTFDLHRRDLNLAKELRMGGSTEPGREGHLGFGLGKHFCIGYELARTEAVVGSTRLVERWGGRQIRLAPGHDDLAPSILGNSFQALPQLPLVRTAS